MSEVENILDKANSFLNRLFCHLEESKINVSSYELDHVCYRVETEERYKELKDLFKESNQLLDEVKIAGRLISTFKLSKPIKFQGRKIYLLELPAPKKGRHYVEGFEHGEFVINLPFEIFIEENKRIQFNTKAISKKINPDISIDFGDCSVKFHYNNLEYVIKYLQ